MGVAKDIIKEAGKTIRKPGEDRENIEAGATKTGPMAKVLIWVVIFGCLAIGVILLFQGKLLVLKAYCSFLESFGRVFVPLMILVGLGRAFKHSRWSKTE